MADATIMPVTGQLPTDIGAILSLISGLSGSGATDAIANRADPWGPQRGQYQDQLNAFMKDPSSVLQDPAFKAAEGVGAENISRQAGAAGMAGSGNRLADLFTYGQTAGLNFEQQKFNQLQELAGVTAGSPAAAAGIQAGALQNKGANLATGLAGVLPMLAQLLGLGGGASGGLGSALQQLFGGGGTNPLAPNPTTTGIYNDPTNPSNPLTGGPPSYDYGNSDPSPNTGAGIFPGETPDFGQFTGGGFDWGNLGSDLFSFGP